MDSLDFHGLSVIFMALKLKSACRKAQQLQKSTFKFVCVVNAVHSIY